MLPLCNGRGWPIDIGLIPRKSDRLTSSNWILIGEGDSSSDNGEKSTENRGVSPVPIDSISISIGAYAIETQ